MPTFDPALKDVIEWENGHTEFPHGPLFWLDQGDYIELKTSGSVDKKEREELVCKIKKTFHDNDVSETPNLAPVAGAIRTGHVHVPTATDEVSNVEQKEALPAANGSAPELKSAPAPEVLAATSSLEPATEVSDVVVQEGEIIPAVRPEPTTFHSATEDLATLSINEKVEAPLNGSANGPHQTLAANLLDPAVGPTGIKPVVPA
jgi:hypothetical protein